MNGNYTYLNRAALDITCKKRVDGLHLRDVHPRWANKIIWERAIPATIDEGKWRGEIAVIGREGVEIPVSQVILAHSDSEEGGTYLSTIARDVSDTKRLEKEVRERLYFEENLLLIAKIFGYSETPDFQQVLSFLGETFHVDLAYMFLFKKGSNITEIIWDWFANETYREA